MNSGELLEAYPLAVNMRIRIAAFHASRQGLEQIIKLNVDTNGSERTCFVRDGGPQDSEVGTQATTIALKEASHRVQPTRHGINEDCIAALTGRNCVKIVAMKRRLCWTVSVRSKAGQIDRRCSDRQVPVLSACRGRVSAGALI